jgi:mono/diheme cytochrome c family protein
MNGIFRNWWRTLLYASFALLPVLLLGGCSWISSIFNNIFPSPPIYLDQGWSDLERTSFYYTSQGSRLIRRDWFLALERDDSQDLFLADGLKRFGYLPGSHVPGVNPDKLPIGFAVDPPATREWIGMTCAACHTSDIAYGGKTLRVDGAPASADMFEFLAKLDLALQKAANDTPAFLRFAERVLGANNNSANQQTLREDSNTGLRAFSTKFAKFVTQSTPSSPWGPARLDAFGMIFNRVASIDLGIDINSQPPNAPVSYPFLWGTSWHNWTQWNGAVPNDTQIKRLARNAGQVLGVFGTIDFNTTPTYPSSVNRLNLLQLEQWVSTLKAPPWPADIFGAPDPAKVARGKLLYAGNCINCHKLVPEDQPPQIVQVTNVPVTVVKTDPTMTNMVANRLVPSAGSLQGRFMNVFPLPPRTIGSNELATDILSHAVIGVLANIGFLQAGSPPPTSPAINALFDSTVAAEKNYKARPLNGIWATGPYLHNGSVRTLYQVLLPEAQREASFQVGGREFDPVEVGFKNAPGVINFTLDTNLPGNSKSGHPFGDALTDPDRWDLVEYLKTL